MIHRELVLLLGGALTVGRRLRAQQKAMLAVGYLHFTSPGPFAPFVAVPPDGRSGRKVLRDGAAPGGRNGTTQLHQHFGRTGTDRACLDDHPELLHCRVFRSISRIAHRLDRSGEQRSRAPFFVTPRKVLASRQCPRIVSISGRVVMDVPETRYAKSGDIRIAYQTAGTGPV